VSGNPRIFLTGRPHIEDEVKKGFIKIVEIPVSPTPGDIGRYLEMRPNRDTDPHAMGYEFRADIIRVILENISEV